MPHQENWNPIKYQTKGMYSVLMKVNSTAFTSVHFLQPCFVISLILSSHESGIGVVLSLSYIFVMASVATLEMEQRVTIVIWDLQHVSNTRRFFTRYTEFNPTSFCMYIKGDSRMTHQQSFFFALFDPNDLSGSFGRLT